MGGTADHVFSVAVRDKEAKATFAVPGAPEGARVEAIGEGRTIEVRDRWREDASSPCQVHL